MFFDTKLPYVLHLPEQNLKFSKSICIEKKSDFENKKDKKKIGYFGTFRIDYYNYTIYSMYIYYFSISIIRTPNYHNSLKNYHNKCPAPMFSVPGSKLGHN